MTNGRHQPSKPLDDRDGRRPGRIGIPWRAGRGSRWILLAAAGVGLCAIMTGALLAVFSSPGGRAGNNSGLSNGSAAAAARPAQPTSPVRSSTTGPDITNAGIAKTALRYPPARKGQIVRWASGLGGTAWSAVTAQLGDVTQTGGAGLYSPLRVRCTNLVSSVRTAQSAPTIPDAVMQRSYARVLSRLAVTAANCRNAISVHPDGDEGQEINVNKALLDPVAAAVHRRVQGALHSHGRDPYAAQVSRLLLRTLQFSVQFAGERRHAFHRRRYSCRRGRAGRRGIHVHQQHGPVPLRVGAGASGDGPPS